MSTTANTLTEVQAAIAMLKDGGLVAFPTDTLYALGADASNDDAVGRVFAIKGREAGKALPLFVSGAAMAAECAELDATARSLAERFWPGALTLVLLRQPSFRSLALAGGETVALRAPDSATALEIVAGLGRPVTGTSGNRSGGADPVTAAAVRAQLGDAVDLIVDGGPCPVGVSSTVVDCTQDPPKILREGALPRPALEAALSRELA